MLPHAELPHSRGCEFKCKVQNAKLRKLFAVRKVDFIEINFEFNRLQVRYLRQRMNSEYKPSPAGKVAAVRLTDEENRTNVR